jgi:hypothetical protein
VREDAKGLLLLSPRNNKTKDDEAKDMAEQLQAIIAATNQHIRTLHALGFSSTAKLFAIAKLDLLVRMHGISEHEFKAFCDALESGAGVANEAEVISFAASKPTKG